MRNPSPNSADAKAIAESRLADMRQGKRQTKPDETADGIAFRWRVINGNEHQESIACAIAHFVKLGIPDHFRSAQDITDEITWQILFRAMRDPDDLDRTISKSVDELRELMDPDERDILINRYLDYQSDINPTPDQISEENYAAVVEAVKKKDPSALNDLEPYMLRAFLLTTDLPL